MEYKDGKPIYNLWEFTKKSYNTNYPLPKPIEDAIYWKKVQFVKDQLTSISPNADWNNRGIDRATDLARIFVNANITDIWALQIYPVDYYLKMDNTFETEAGTVMGQISYEPQRSYAFTYYGQNVGYLGESGSPVNFPFFELGNTGFKIGWSAEGHGHIDYVVRPNSAGTSLEIVPVWASSSDAGAIRDSLKMVVGFFAMALPIAGVSLGAIIGSAILPASVAAAYPMAATIVGNVALSTALNGGDVEGAVKNVFISATSGYAGAETGAFVSSATDSALVGALASAATQAALSGGDMKMALATAGLKQGISLYDQTQASAQAQSSVDFFAGTFDQSNVQSFTNPNGGFMDPSLNINYLDSTDNSIVDFADSFDWSYSNVFGNDPLVGFGNDPFASSQIGFNYDQSGGLTFQDYSGGLENFDWNQTFNTPNLEFNTNSTVDYSTGFENAFSTDAIGNVQTAAPNQNPPNKDSPVWTPTQVIQGISAAALAVISLIKAYRSLDTPKINTVARKVNQDGSVSVITDNGMVSTQGPNGQIVTTKPPIGIPQATVNGNMVVNNGDGTYTVVSPSGQSATFRYGANNGGSSDLGGFEITPTLLALGVGVLFLMKK